MKIIEQAYREQAPETWHTNQELMQAVATTIAKLDAGEVRVAQPDSSQEHWLVNSWVKQAVLIYLRTQATVTMELGQLTAKDKIPLKYNPENIESADARIVPPATIRYGAFIGSNCVIMPAFVNIGAYVGANTMIDTWATVGSCAQIGANVHISGGAGIGGVLEPLQARPTIIEDNCFIGARSEVVEGVRVGQGAVIGMGVMLSQSTKIYDRINNCYYQGQIPANAVVVPGSVASSCGNCQLAAAIIVKYADANTRSKTSVNELLRF